MRYVPIAFLLVGCAPAPIEPPPSTPDPHAVAAQENENAAAMASAEATVKAAADREQGDKLGAEIAEKEEREKRCAAERPARAAQLRTYALEAKRALEIVGKHGKWIASQCELVDSRGTHVSVQRDKTGVVIRTRQVGRADEVSCRGALPTGVSKDDVRAVIFNAEPGPLMREDCTEFDKPLGLDTEVSSHDAAGLQKAIDWKAR